MHDGEHTFGGDWTEDKLRRVKQYLDAYQGIFKTNVRAKHFRTWYVDAFAGTGSRTEPSVAQPAGGFFDDVYTETTAYKDGSARIALGLTKPFDRYLFIEGSRARVSELEAAVRSDFAARAPSCEFRHGDANQVLIEWCQQRDWSKDRAVVFLDPYGMQVNWATVETLAATKAIDLWYLFPLGIGVSRMMPRNGAFGEGWRERIDAVFGTTAWYARFYRTTHTTSLFEDEDVQTVHRAATVTDIADYIHERLETCFIKVPKGRPLFNSRNSPLYLLCFAASNDKGAPTAARIAQHILKA